MRTARHSAATTDVFDAWNHGVGIRGSTFSYDALGRRITESDASNSQYFYYNGVQMIENAPQSGSSVRHQQFVYGLAYIDQVILRDRDADNSSGTGSLGATGSGLEERLYYTHNREYSVTGLVSQTGTMLERTAYDPFGGIQYFSATYGSGTSTSAYANTVGFTGRWKDPTGMWYFRARYEDPVLGRFISRDSMGYADGMSLYCGFFVPDAMDPYGTLVTIDTESDAGHTFTWDPLDAATEGITNIFQNITCNCVPCTCGFSIDCKVKLTYKMRLNQLYADKDAVADINGVTEAQAYGHEQMHISSMNGEANMIKQLFDPDTVCKKETGDECQKRSMKLKADILAALTASWAKEAAHDQNYNPKIPMAGKGYAPNGPMPADPPAPAKP